jgi:hypothetical protein
MPHVLPVCCLCSPVAASASGPSAPTTLSSSPLTVALIAQALSNSSALATGLARIFGALLLDTQFEPIVTRVELTLVPPTPPPPFGMREVSCARPSTFESACCVYQMDFHSMLFVFLVVVLIPLLDALFFDVHTLNLSLSCVLARHLHEQSHPHLYPPPS